MAKPFVLIGIGVILVAGGGWMMFNAPFVGRSGVAVVTGICLIVVAISTWRDRRKRE